jgi:HK97 family phage portal protein
LFRKLLESRMMLSDIPGISGFFNPADWLIDLMGGANTQSGATVTANTAVLNSNVYTCASILGGDIGKLQIVVYKRTKNGRVRDDNHRVSELLNKRPNKYMNAYTFKEALMMHMVTWGNAYAWIERNKWGEPEAIYPLHPALTDIRYDIQTGNIWYVTTYPFPGGDTRKMPASDVFHLKAIGTSGLKGITPIAVIREKIGIQQQSEKFLGAFYANGTATSGVLKTDAKLDPDAKNRAREEWQKLYTGLSNAHKIAVLDAGLSYQSLGMPLADAQFLETQRFGIAEVAKIYKIPPHKLGMLDKATLNNIEHQALEYVKNTLMPIGVNWEQEIAAKLFMPTEKAYYAKFDYRDELRADSKSRAEYYESMVTIGGLSINEIRDLEDYNGIGDMGDKHLVSLNYTTLDNLEDYQRAKAGLNAGKGGDTGGQEGDPVPSG